MLRGYVTQVLKELAELYMLQIQKEPKHQTVSSPLLPHLYPYTSKCPLANHLSE